MIGIGGVGGIGVSLARTGHGGAHGQRQDAPAEHSSQSKPGDARGHGASGHEDGAAVSGNDWQGAAQKEAFDAALRSVAIQIVNDSMGDLDDALDETEEGA
ncbi:hypothetical protein [Mesorhizobium amorphae]|uniref:hypothetical protein n=1 Tax=Mesorhizobium amorphae TaxID=71433 RepID=UPI0009DB55A7|nr:hypothetical protein [Mesorhizobium amorphae]